MYCKDCGNILEEKDPLCNVCGLEQYENGDPYLVELMKLQENSVNPEGILENPLHKEFPKIKQYDMKVVRNNNVHRFNFVERERQVKTPETDFDWNVFNQDEKDEEIIETVANKQGINEDTALNITMNKDTEELQERVEDKEIQENNDAQEHNENQEFKEILRLQEMSEPEEIIELGESQISPQNEELKVSLEDEENIDFQEKTDVLHKQESEVPSEFQSKLDLQEIVMTPQDGVDNQTNLESQEPQKSEGSIENQDSKESKDPGEDLEKDQFLDKESIDTQVKAEENLEQINIKNKKENNLPPQKENKKNNFFNRVKENRSNDPKDEVMSGELQGEYNSIKIVFKKEKIEYQKILDLEIIKIQEKNMPKKFHRLSVPKIETDVKIEAYGSIENKIENKTNTGKEENKGDSSTKASKEHKKKEEKQQEHTKKSKTKGKDKDKKQEKKLKVEREKPRRNKIFFQEAIVENEPKDKEAFKFKLIEDSTLNAQEIMPKTEKKLL